MPTLLKPIVAYSSDQFVLPLPSGHRFPMDKYRMVREEVMTWPTLELREPPAATDGQLALAHHPDYVAAVVSGSLSRDQIRSLGFPWSQAMVERARRSTGATIAASRAALTGGAIAFNLAGGTHHAGHARGAGFCTFNDSAVAALLMQAERLARRVVILDLDVHQGDGTAEILKSDPSVLTVSMHGEHNYPFEKIPCDIDIGLADGTDDDSYLQRLREVLAQIDAWGSAELLIFLAGADPLKEDRLGRLSLSLEGIGRRDRMVFEWACERAMAVAVSMAGGYAVPIELTVSAQLQTIRLGLEVFRDHWVEC